jgi:hypothetical protein
MAKNTGNNRIPVKWVRDRAKAAYDKKDTCCICGTGVDLELHHFNSITILLENWASAQKYDISTDDGILAVRDEFIAEHQNELYEQVRTLCNKHHVALHRIFGKAPPIGSAARQERWIGIQQDKFNGNEVTTKTAIVGSFFSAFT